MGGRWSILGVVGLGLVAALCAALFVAAMGSRSEKDAGESAVTILIAAADLPAMQKLGESAIVEKQVAPGEKPAGALTDPVQAVGRILSREVVAGQALTAQDLLDDGEGARLASALPAGMRAVAIEVEDTTSMRALLYPGCSVDVLVSLRRVGGIGDQRERSRTLLQNVRVLAVEQRSLYSESTDKAQEDERSSRTARPRNLTVTLLVDPQQARELHGAGGEGQLSLALRNPLDDSLTQDPAPPVEQVDGRELAGAPSPEQGAQAAPAPEPWRTLIIRKDKSEVRAFGEGKGTDLAAGEPAKREQSLSEVDTDSFDPEEN